MRKRELVTPADFLTATIRVLNERQDQYGDIADDATRLAALWNAYLQFRPFPQATLTPEDTIMMRALGKLVRASSGGEFKADNYIDLLGYAAHHAALEAKRQHNRKGRHHG